ncbi:MAG: hypothetical protein DMF81_10510 [Acidobacteria bacterium]|nr:MAG: hypothetical protein DMF81_10510 [Acidobacteriota bacterium]
MGVLLAEIRRERMLAGSGRQASHAQDRHLGPELDLRIETRVVSGRPPSGSRTKSWLWPASLLIHAGLLVAVVVVPLLMSEPLPVPTREARAFFVGPAMVAPPPPPPAAPPAAARPSAPRPTVPPSPSPAAAFTAPIDVPDPVVLADPLEPGPAGDGAPAGEPGGVAGGVAGGIVGGVLAARTEPPPPVVPVRVGGEIKEPKKLKHVSPVYPEIAARAKVHGSIVLECIVSRQGHVTEVKVVRGIPLLNEAAIDAVKQWAYTPTLKDGVPVPVILTVTVHFDL